MKEVNKKFDVEDGAERLAQSFLNGEVAQEKKDKQGKPPCPITSAQLRKFYNEFKSLERKYQQDQLTSSHESKKEAFTRLLPQIKINKAKVSYARARKTVPPEFETWLKNSIDAITSCEDFEAFMLHFEAIVGYAYGHGLSDKKN